MNCKDIAEDLGAYLDGELDSARRASLEGHVASCEACRAELERLRKLSKLVGEIPRDAAPAGLAARIVAAARAPRPKVLGLPRWSGALVAAAAALLVGVVSFVAMRDRDARDARKMATPMAETARPELAKAPADAAEGIAIEDAAAPEAKAPAGRARPAAVPPRPVSVGREKLEERARARGGASAGDVRRASDRRRFAFKRPAAPAPAKPAPPAGPSAARARRELPARVGGKSIAAAPTPRPEATRPARKAKDDAGSRAYDEPLVGRRVRLDATGRKARPARDDLRPGQSPGADRKAAGAPAEPDVPARPVGRASAQPGVPARPVGRASAQPGVPARPVGRASVAPDARAPRGRTRVARPEEAEEVARTPGGAADEIAAFRAKFAAASRARAKKEITPAAPRPEAERSDELRRRVAELLANGEREGQRGMAKGRAVSKLGKAGLLARATLKTAGESLIRLELHADDPGRELAKITAAARRLGGSSISREVEAKSRLTQAQRAAPAQGRDAPGKAAAERPTIVRVRIPRDRRDEFLASLEGLTLPGPGEEATQKREADRAPAGTGRAPVPPAVASQAAAPGAGQPSTKPVRWITIEIVVGPRSPKPAADR